MKGYPLIRLAVVVLFLALLFWPVYKLTLRHPSQPSRADITPRAPETIQNHPLRATLLVHAAPSPLHCSIREEGRILLSEKNVISPGEYRSEVDIDKGVDLVVAADWESEDPHAMRVQVLVYGYQTPLEKTFWAEKSLLDVLPIPASFLP